MGLMSAQAWGCPYSIKCLFSSHSLPSPLSLISLFLIVVLEITRKIQMFSTNWRDLLHSTPFPLSWGWIAVYEVNYEIRWVIVNSGIGSHTSCFSLNTAWIVGGGGEEGLHIGGEEEKDQRIGPRRNLFGSVLRNQPDLGRNGRKEVQGQT
jgi:hypothetical protein